MLANCIQAMSEMLNCKLEFLSAIIWNQKSYFLAVASDRLLIIGERMERVEQSIEFLKIQGIVISTKLMTLFRIHADMIYEMQSLDRKQLIPILRYCWKTDFMYKNLQFKDLPLYKDDFSPTGQVSLLCPPNMSVILKNRFYFRNYYFQLPPDYKPAYQDGVYVHQTNPACKVIVQISEPMPLILLQQVGERENLQFYVETFIDTVIQGMDKRQEAKATKPVNDDDAGSEQEFKMKLNNTSIEYWVLSSSQYKKRQNLSNDTSEWSGWEIHARTQSQDIMVIIMRRRFIPPLIETYQEFLFILHGPEHQSIVQNLNDVELLKQTIEQDLEEHSFKNLLRNAVDSLESDFIVQQEQYQILIRLGANTLLYNSATLYHVYNKYKIVPQFIMYGIRYLQCLFLRLMGYDRDRFEGLMRDMEMQYKDIMKANQEVLTEILVSEDSPTKLLQLFEETSYVKDRSINEGERKCIWQRKLTRYIAYCVDGGILQNFFSLKDIIPLLHSRQVNQEIKQTLTELVDYCLYIVPRDTTYSFRPGNLMRKLEQLSTVRMYFNEDIAQTLIECNFFSQELLLNDRAQMYQQIMLLFLQSGNIQLVISTCKHIINFHADIKHQAGLTEQMINAYKPICHQLIEIYQASNRTLSTLASIALFNMCTNSREFKYIVMQGDQSKQFVQKLLVKDNSLLHYTLKLIYCVMSITQNIERLLASNLTDYLYNILEGSKIRGCQYDAKCLIVTCQVLQVCMLAEVELKQTDHLVKLLIDMVVTVADQYFLDQEECAMLKSETLLVICKICQKNAEVKRSINFEFIPYILTILEKLNILQVQERIVTLMCILIKENKEWALQWCEHQPNLCNTLQVYHTRDVQSSNYLLSQIKNVLDENKKMKENETKKMKMSKAPSKVPFDMRSQASEASRGAQHSQQPSLHTYVHSKNQSAESNVPVILKAPSGQH